MYVFIHKFMCEHYSSKWDRENKLLFFLWSQFNKSGTPKIGGARILLSLGII